MAEPVGYAGPMKIYADSTPRGAAQLLGDLLLVVWVVVWVRLALVVRDVTLALAEPGERISDAASGLADQLRAAGEGISSVPLVGDDVSAPFVGAGDAADDVASAAQAQVEAVADLAFWLAVAVGAIPVLLALAIYLPMRLRFVREATAGQRFVDSADDLDLFALRALARQPMHRLARVSHDPVGAWRDRDPDVVRRLAELELRASGLAYRRE